VEPGPFSTHFFSNLVNGSDADVMKDYGHVGEFFQGFEQQVKGMFEDKDAPTDPMIVVKDFERLIDMENGKRPLRTISGLDFGFQALNDASENFRKGTLEFMGITDWDGPRP
jgi:hypothetical protein